MKKLLLVFLLIPNFALAAENGPIELMIGIDGMLLIVVFGEFQPINPANTNLAKSQDRRVEIKLTQRYATCKSTGG